MKASKASKSTSNQSPKLKTNKKQSDVPLRNNVLTPENVNKTTSNSTRTSGGISKCLLTPCRRMGLTRNRIKSVNSPLQENKSPLTISTPKLPNPEKISPLKLDEKIENVQTDVENECSKESVIVTPTSPLINNTNEPLGLLKSCVVLVNKKVMPKNKRKLINEINDAPPPTSIEKSPRVALLNKQVSKSSTTSNSSSKSSKTKSLKMKIVKKDDNMEIINVESPPSSQNSIPSLDDDDEDDFVTIIDRKTYKKAKLQLNKSSNSEDNTSLQNEIDEIKKRISLKQEKANIMQHSTVSQQLSIVELQELILGWREGCQKALEEILILSKEKGHFEGNNGMEQLLKMFNIPHDLVKYDPELGFEGSQ